MKIKLYQPYNKYRNTKIMVDNINFASIKEATRYKDLKLMLAAKEIKDLKLHPKFLLQKKFVDSAGHLHREINYIADFVYISKNNETIVEDVKGLKTEVYKIKKKLFLYKYRDFIFREI